MTNRKIIIEITGSIGSIEARFETYCSDEIAPVGRGILPPDAVVDLYEKHKTIVLNKELDY